MITNQDTRRLLPPTTTNPPSSTTNGNHPHQLSGFTTSRLPPKIPPTTTEEESQLVAALAQAIIKFRNPVTTVAGNTHKNRTKSDVNLSINQEHAARTVKRNPIHRTVLQSANNSVSTGYQEQRKTTTSPPFPGTETESVDREESPQVKRMRKMEEMVTEIEEGCWELRCDESGLTEEPKEHEEYDDDDKNHPFQTSVEQDDVREERVQFKQHDDGGVCIRLSCSCGKSYEMLHTQSGCFYRLI